MPKAKAKRPLTKRQKFAKQFTPEERKNWKNNTVTDAIIKAIDKGVPEWRKPWRTMRSEGHTDYAAKRRNRPRVSRHQFCSSDYVRLL
jgi:hypothetical protein